MGVSKGVGEAERVFEDVPALDCLAIVLESVLLCFWLAEEMRGRFMASYIDLVIL